MEIIIWCFAITIYLIIGMTLIKYLDDNGVINLDMNAYEYWAFLASIIFPLVVFYIIIQKIALFINDQLP